MKELKKYLALLLAILVILPGSFVSASPDNNPTIIKKDDGVSIMYSPEAAQKDLDRQFEEFKEESRQSSISPLNQYQWEYKYERSPKQRVYVGGYVGRQLPEGTSVAHKGGGAYVSSDGGPTISAGVSVDLPKVKYVTLSVEIGNFLGTSGSGVSGIFVPFPSTDWRYKVYCNKGYDVEVYATYRRLLRSNDDWEVYTTSVGKTAMSEDYSAHRTTRVEP